MGNWALNRIAAVANAPVAAGKPDAFAWEHDKSQHVVYRGVDNQIHEIYFKRDLFNKEWRYGGALSVTAKAAPIAGDPTGFAWEHDHTQHIIYRAADGHIHEIFYKKDLTHHGWEYGGSLTGKIGAPPAVGNPSAYAWEGDNTQHIVYRAGDGYIHEIFFKRDLTHHGWEYGGALSAKVGAPASSGDPVGFAWEHDKTMHVIYRAADGQIHEVFYKRDLTHHGWEYGGALSAKANAPAAADDPNAFAWEDDHTQHIIYRTPDNAIQEIFYKKDLTHGGWEYGGALSTKLGAPPAAGKPFGYVWGRDHTMHIVYRTPDGQIHEIFYKKDLTHHGWEYGGPLSAKVGAPPAADDPIGWAWEGDDTQHVAYRAADGYIQELWQR